MILEHLKDVVLTRAMAQSIAKKLVDCGEAKSAHFNASNSTIVVDGIAIQVRIVEPFKILSDFQDALVQNPELLTKLVLAILYDERYLELNKIYFAPCVK